MTKTFQLEHRFPTIPIDLFERYLNHPDLIADLDAMPAFKSRDLIDTREDDDGTIHWRFKVVAGGKVPPAARKVLSEDMLTWYEDTVFKPDEHCIYWKIEPVKVKNRLDCSGTWKLIPDGEGTRRIIEGSVTVKVRLVGKVAEMFLVDELKRNYEVEPEVQRKFYERMRAQESDED